MELHEFHVGNAASRAPRHRDAVAGRAARCGRIEIGAAGAAAGEDGRARGQRFDPLGRAVVGIQPVDRAAGGEGLGVAPGDQVDRHHVGHQRILGCCAAAASSACWTAKPVASATWTMRRWLWPPSRVRCSAPPSSANGTPSSISRGDRRGRGVDDMLDHFAVVEPGAGDHRVADMRFEAVAFLEHRGDAALRPAGRAFAQRALGDHRDLVRRARFSAAVSPAAPDPTIRTSATLLMRRAASAGQAQEHILQIGIAGRDVDDAEPFGGERGEHFAGIDLVLAIGDLERARVDQRDILEAGAVGTVSMSRSNVTTTALSCALAISSRVGSLAISLPWLMIAMRSQSCSASSR